MQERIEKVLNAINSGTFLVTSTNLIEGSPVVKYLGIVAGEAVLGTNVARDIFAKMRNFSGGRVASLEKELENARQTAITEMVLKAIERGGNAVIGIDVDYNIMDGPVVFVSVNGTAVEVQPR